MNVNTIVMLTQVVECGRPGLSKCHEYWPSDNKPLILKLVAIIITPCNYIPSTVTQWLYGDVTGNHGDAVIIPHTDPW